MEKLQDLLLCTVLSIYDLKNTHFLLQDFFIEDDPMCVGCKLNEEEDSVQEFLDLIQLWIQDTQSILAVEDETGEAVGLLVGRANDCWSHTKTMSRMRVKRNYYNHFYSIFRILNNE